MCFFVLSVTIYSFFPASMAHRYIEIIATEAYLVTAGYYFTVLGDSSIYSCFSATGANRFYFGDRISYLKKALATREELGQKVRTQTEAKDGDITFVHYTTELIYLLGGEKLTLVSYNNVHRWILVFINIKNILCIENRTALGRKTDT